jgi:hypothetical protein
MKVSLSPLRPVASHLPPAWIAGSARYPTSGFRIAEEHVLGVLRTAVEFIDDFDRPRAEWVLLLRGEAVLQFESGESLTLTAGGHLLSRSIPYSLRSERLSWEHHRLLAKLHGTTLAKVSCEAEKVVDHG